MANPLPGATRLNARNLLEETHLHPAFLAIFTALLFFPGLGTRDFWAPVEPRYAEIARVMLAKGDWLIPTVNGQLYTDKPILYFWLVLLGSKLVGSVNEWTVRLPPALSALGLVFTTYFLGRDLFNAKVGLLASLVLATSARVLWEARWAHTDMTFTFLFALSLTFFSRAIFQRRQKEFLLAYALMGLATLAKGLIGIVLPGLIVLVFVTARREWRSLFEWRPVAGIAIFLLVTAPWFAAVSFATDGKWLEDFIWFQHIQRYSGGAGHREPFFYYFVNFPADFLPWTVFAVPAIFAYWSRFRLLREPIPLFLFVWFIAVFLFFDLSDTKRGLYLLPIMPPAAIFVACYFDDLLERRIPESSLHRWLALLFFNLLWVLSLSLPVVAWFFYREGLWISFPFALVMAGGGLITVRSIWRGLPSWVFFSTVFTTAAGMLCLSLWVLPSVDPYKSPRFLSLQVKEKVPLKEPIYVYADTMNDFNFYTETEIIPILSSEAEVGQAIAKAQSIYLLIRERDSKQLAFAKKARILADGDIGGKKWFLMRLSQEETSGEPAGSS